MLFHLKNKKFNNTSLYSDAYFSCSIREISQQQCKKLNVQEREPIYRLLHHYNSLSNKMDNFLLDVRDNNHKYIVAERRRALLFPNCNGFSRLLKFMKNILRNEVEQTIKNLHLDRNRIFEVSKMKYAFIIKQIETIFVANGGTIHWANMGKFNSNFSSQYKTIGNNWSWYYSLPQIIPTPAHPIYVLLEDIKGYTYKYWLYEMYLPELITIFYHISYADLYLVSKKYDWLISENHEEVLTFVGDHLNTSSLGKNSR